MVPTRSFEETVAARIAREPAFRDALLAEASERLLCGEVELGKAVLRDLIDASVGFERMAPETGEPRESLMRMLGPEGTPTTSNLLGTIDRLRAAAGTRQTVAAAR